MEPTAERNYSKLEWMFYIVILPLLFITILTGFLLWFLDYDLKGKILETLNKIPYIEKLIDDEQFKNKDYLTINNSKEQLLITVDELKKTLNEKNLSLTQVEKKVTTKDEEINKLITQIEELEAKLNEKNMSEKTREEELANLAKIYANMSTKNAANIISNIGFEEAVLILAQMNVDSISKILEKMDQKTAADLSILLKDQKYSRDQDILALQERINLLVKEIDELKNNQTITPMDYQQLALTFANMDPNKAAEAIVTIYLENINKAQNIITAMDTVSRSNILNQMDPFYAAKLTASLVD